MENNEDNLEAYYDFAVMYNQKRVEKKLHHLVSVNAVNVVLNRLIDKVGEYNIHKIDLCRQLTLNNHEETVTARKFITVSHFKRFADNTTFLADIDKRLAIDLKNSLEKEYKINNKPKPTKCPCCGQLLCLNELYEASERLVQFQEWGSDLQGFHPAWHNFRDTFKRIKEIKNG